MFIGHHAVAFASKPLARRVSLGTFFLAAMWLDLVWPVLLLAGVEHVRIVPGIVAFNSFDFYDYPWSHSLVMALVWSALFAIVMRARRYDVWSAVLVGAAVFSHWVLDYVTHRPDLALWPGSETRVGLGLWNSVAGTIAVESALFAGALAIYARSTRPRDRVGWWALWSLAIVLAISYVASIMAPPPPSTTALAFGALAAALFVVWAYWIDRHRA